jgi:hypothetical protein
MKTRTLTVIVRKTVTALVVANLFTAPVSVVAAPAGGARASATTGAARSAAAVAVGAASARGAAPSPARGGTPPPTRSALAPDMRAQFNRQTVGATSGANDKLRERAYAVLDKQRAAAGAPIGLRSHAFQNDGRNGSTVLPQTTGKGQAVTYQTTYLRPHTGRKYDNARITLGSDGRAHLSVHHGDKGGAVKRIQ